MVGHEQGGRALGRHLIGLTVAVLAVALLLLWAWNGTAVELMGATPAGFRHALSLAAAIAGIAALTVAAGRLAGSKPRRDGGGSA
jgi:hypothetical protein